MLNTTKESVRNSIFLQYQAGNSRNIQVLYPHSELAEGLSELGVRVAPAAIELDEHIATAADKVNSYQPEQEAARNYTISRKSGANALINSSGEVKNA